MQDAKVGEMLAIGRHKGEVVAVFGDQVSLRLLGGKVIEVPYKPAASKPVAKKPVAPPVAPPVANKIEE